MSFYGLLKHCIKRRQPVSGIHSIVLLLCAAIASSAPAQEPSLADTASIDVTDRAAEVLRFCQQRQLNTNYCILIDMSIHSGKKRFFVWDFNQQKTILSCLVSHGCCNNPWGADLSKDNPRFSNVDGSHCSALGKYKMGKRGWSNWGININYLMHGLEATNNNSVARQIVFHSWDQVADEEVYPNGTPEGWGCPAISNRNMKFVDSILKSQTKPVLMWIYNR